MNTITKEASHSLQKAPKRRFNYSLRSSKRLFMAVLFTMVCLHQTWAYNFSAVSSSGHTLYYEILSGTTKNVGVVRPGSGSSYNNYISGNVVIPATVSYNGTTYNVTELRNVSGYGYGVFESCSGLTSVTIPNSVTSIGNYAFYNCSGLTSVTIPNSVTSIGSNAFSYCSGLTSVTIPNSVTTIGNFAFYYCTGLTSVTIPNSVTTIGHNAFYLVKNIIYNGSATGSQWGALNVNGYIDDGFVYSDSTKTILTAYIGTSSNVTIPSSVTTIARSAFEGCTDLTSVTIGNSVTSIGEGAFSSCSGLTSVTIPNSVTSIGNYAFSECIGLTSVTIPNSVTSIGNYAFSECTGLTSVTIPNSVTSIGEGAFYYCAGLTSVTIGNSVTSIGEYAFYYCRGLTSVTIPNSVTSIRKSAFYYCSGLTSVTIPNSVTSIGSSAFSGCSSLTSVSIPDSVTSIGYHAFSNCTSLTTLNFNAINCNDFDYNNHPFTSCPISTINICDSVQRIPAYFASGKTTLTSISIGNSVTSIGNYAFRGCSSLTTLNFNAINCSDFSSSNYPFSDSPISTITIGDSVQRIPAYFVYNKTAISEIIIPNGVTSIGNSAFYGCSGLDTIIIPNGTTTIEESTFENCNNLAYAVIGKNMSSIENKAFYGCNNMHNVKSLASFPPTLGSNIFSATAILKVPCGSAAYYSAPAAKWADYFISIEEVCDNITITVISANENMGTVSGGGEYAFGEEVIITATPKQGYRFVSWNDGNTDNTRTITVETEATYIATFEEEIGIETASELDELRLYPNPTSGTITFSSTDIRKVEVMDAMGRMVAEYIDSYVIDLSKLSKGHYTMRITTDNGVTIRKVIRN